MKNKLHTKELYLPTDPDILQEQERCLELQYDYNHTRSSEGTKRAELLSKMLAEIGDGCYIEPPLHANWGGHHVHFGKNVYANFNLTMVMTPISTWATTRCSAPTWYWQLEDIPYCRN